MKKIADVYYGEAESQNLDVNLPDCDSFPVFVFFHGGGLKTGSKLCGFIPDLVEKGVCVVSANYRKYPDAKYPEFVEDAASVVAWTIKNIHKYGNATHIFVGGSSAGGYLSQMLCFNKECLGKHGVSNSDIAGYFLDAGQPTAHFNVLNERGLDTRRVIIDESAPLYYVDDSQEYPPMRITVSDKDLENRYEQTMLLMSTLKHFGHDMNKVRLVLCENSTHCSYISKTDDNGKYIYADMVYDFISEIVKK